MASSQTYGGKGEPIEDQSIGELVATVTRDLSLLVNKEIELAKTELTEQAKRAGLGAGFLGGAGFIGLFALIFLSFAGAFAIATGGGIPIWAGFLCIAGLYGGIAGLLAVMGLGKVTKLGPPKRTIRTVKDDISWAKHPTQNPPNHDLEELRASHAAADSAE